MAREGAFRLEYEAAVADKLHQHRVHNGRERDAKFSGSFLRRVAQLLRGLYCKGRIHTSILLLVRFTVNGCITKCQGAPLAFTWNRLPREHLVFLYVYKNKTGAKGFPNAPVSTHGGQYPEVQVHGTGEP